MVSRNGPHMSTKWTRVCILLLVSGVLASACSARQSPERIYRLAEMNTDQIRSLDRERTVILIPGGGLEEHGPYMPSFTDGYRNERLIEELAAAIAKRPGWTAVVFPMIPLGTDSANRLGGKFVFPGAYTIRSAT